MVYDLFLLLFTYAAPTLQTFPSIYSLAVFTTTLTEISYTKEQKNVFKIQNLFGGCTKTFGGPHAARGPRVEDS
jgi:hypothetical protein